MTVALTESKISLRRLPKVPLSSSRSAAAQGGLALVPHAHRQAAPDLDRLCQLAALNGAFALGTIHVQRQANHDQLGSDLLGHFAHPCRHLVAGFQGDLRGDGRCKELGAITGGKAGAAVAVVNS